MLATHQRSKHLGKPLHHPHAVAPVHHGIIIVQPPFPHAKHNKHPMRLAHIHRHKDPLPAAHTHPAQQAAHSGGTAVPLQRLVEKGCEEEVLRMGVLQNVQVCVNDFVVEPAAALEDRIVPLVDGVSIDVCGGCGVLEKGVVVRV